MRKLSLKIAFRYFISRKNTQAVSIIMYTSLVAMVVAVCAMLVILSVFSGLEELNIKLFSNINPDLKIVASKGKVLPDINKIEMVLSSHREIYSFSKTIEEKAYVVYNNKDEIAYLKGVDKNFLKVVRIDTCFQAGRFPNLSSDNEAAFGISLAHRLNIPLNEGEVSLFEPKPGKGLLTQNNAFEETSVYMSGVFFLNEQYENYIFVPIQISRNLLNLPEASAFSIEIKIKDKKNIIKIQQQLKKELGKKYQVLTRENQDASFFKMMKIEQLFIYLIFILVTIIASFNLAGAVIIIILDKKEQSKTLLSLGYSLKELKKLFFIVGVTITIFGIIIGLILGSIITWLQDNYTLVMANNFIPFPVKFTFLNYLVVLLSALFIGIIVSYISSRKPLD